MLLTFFSLLSKLPLLVLHALGAALGWLVYLLSPAYRKRLKENIDRAGYASHRFTAVGESGKSILELPFIWCATPERVSKTVNIQNWPMVQTALDSGRGVIFLTPHLGCFELIGQLVAAKVPFTALYRPPRKAVLKPLIEDTRARHNFSLAPANLAGVRILLKVLKKGGAIGLMPDQVPQQGEGVWANFFGKSAYTMTLSAKLQKMTGAIIILTYVERLPHGRGYVAHFAPFEQDLGETPEQQATAINAAMEQLIACCPAQYFWSYNRYKTPPGISAPGDADKDPT